MAATLGPQSPCAIAGQVCDPTTFRPARGVRPGLSLNPPSWSLCDPPLSAAAAASCPVPSCSRNGPILVTDTVF